MANTRDLGPYSVVFSLLSDAKRTFIRIDGRHVSLLYIMHLYSGHSVYYRCWDICISECIPSIPGPYYVLLICMLCDDDDELGK